VTKIHNPAELGSPPSYSHGIEVPASARTLYVAGQVGWDKDYNVVPGGIAEQTRAALTNLRAVLNAAGMDFTNLVKTTVFMVNIDDYPDFAKVRTEFFGDVKPASTLVVIKQLLKAELLVEIEAVAVAE
jgi:2-iminobutanoate/2-iminopropanoate deaminase